MLGQHQKVVLDSLRRYGKYPSGFRYGSHSTTIRILESLVRKGLVRKEVRTTGYGEEAVEYTPIKPMYECIRCEKWSETVDFTKRCPTCRAADDYDVGDG